MALVDEEERRRAERAHQAALFRYQLIREAADPALSPRQRGAMVRELAAKPHTDPFGRQITVGRGTLDRWLRNWREGGFDALLPPTRQVTPRTPEEVLDLAAALKRENPSRTTAQVVRILTQHLGWGPSYRTVHRHLGRLDLLDRPDGQAPPVFGRFEADRRLGIKLIHSTPGRPEGRGKIERAFRTVRDQFLVEVDEDKIADLGELNRLFTAWVEHVYHRAVHSETGQPPMERWLAAAPFPQPSAAQLREAFRWSEHRTVTKTATVSLLGNIYNVDAALSGGRSIWSSTRSTSRRSKSASRTGRSASPSRTTSPVTPTPRRSRRSPRRPRRPPASTTSA
ncbi:helix-turn-helix domain-containing protein [Streptomyces sp. NPDC002519]